jgi:Carboxypeptidase regulatory-like domain
VIEKKEAALVAPPLSVEAVSFRNCGLPRPARESIITAIQERKTRLAIGTFAAALFAGATAHAQEHLLCFSTDGVFHYRKHCVSRTDHKAPIAAASVPRKFVYVSKAAHSVTIGTVPAGSTHVDLSFDAAPAAFGGPPSVTGPEDEDGTVTLTEKKLGAWTITLDPWWFRKGRLHINVPVGTWDQTITTASGKVLKTHRNIRFPDMPPRRAAAPPPPASRMLVLTGRAVAGDGATPAPFATIAADCRSVTCEAGADGSFRCSIREPQSGKLCIEHPRLGRRTITLDGRRGNVDLGTVALLTGATVRVTRPPHVLLPAEVSISLLRNGAEIASHKHAGERSEVEFAGIEPGDYEVLLAGQELLQRKLFPVRVDGDAAVELPLSLDVYRLTGDVEHRERGLAGAVVTLHVRAGNAEVTTDQSGRFSLEAWAPLDAGVQIASSELSQPFLIMKRASQSEHHWRLVVPHRAITGTVYDASSGHPVRQATLAVNATSDTTRWSRNIQAGADGSFNLTGIAEGTYTITASAPGYLGGQPHELTIARADGDRQVRLPLEVGTLVTVSVVNEAGAPIEGAAILADLTPDGRRARTNVLTDRSGNASIPVRRNAMEAVWFIPRHGSFAMTQLSAADVDRGIRIRVPDPLGKLTLRARTDDERPLAAVRFTLSYNGTPIPPAVLQTFSAIHRFSSVTDANGEATFPLLPIGRYGVQWHQPGREAGVPASVKTVDVGPGQTVLTQTFSLR